MLIVARAGSWLSIRSGNDLPLRGDDGTTTYDETERPRGFDSVDRPMVLLVTRLINTNPRLDIDRS